MSADDVRARLKLAGKHLEEADAALQLALDEVAVAMREGRDELGVEEMAELAGISRPAADRLLERA